MNPALEASSATEEPAGERAGVGRLGRIAILSVVALAVLLRGMALTRPIEALDGVTLPDDAYLALKVARSIAGGHGPRYGDHYTNGFQPLYVFLLVPIYRWLGPEATDVASLDAGVRGALAITAAADVLALLVLLGLLRRRFGWGPGTLTGVLGWAVQPAVLSTALNGLETSLAILFFLLIWMLTERLRGRSISSGAAFTLGACVGLGGLARIDVLAAGAVSAGVLALERLRAGQRRLVVRPWLWAALGFLCACGPWLAYSYHYTGNLYPVSGPAVRLIGLWSVRRSSRLLFYQTMVQRALMAAWRLTPVLWGLAFAFVLLARALVLRARRSTGRAHGWAQELLGSLRGLDFPVAYCLGLFLAYSFYEFGWWFYERYLAPLMILPVVVLAASAAALERAPGRWRTLGPPLVASLVLLTGFVVPDLSTHNWAAPSLQELVLASADSNRGYRNVGLWCRAEFPDGTILGACQSGAIGYYATNLQVVNLDGVVNADAFEALREGRSVDYIRGKGVQYIVDWDINIRFIYQHARGATRTELRKVGDVPALRSWEEPWGIWTVAR